MQLLLYLVPEAIFPLTVYICANLKALYLSELAGGCQSIESRFKVQGSILTEGQRGVSADLDDRCALGASRLRSRSTGFEVQKGVCNIFVFAIMING